jgi:hypothetical protein
VRRRTWRTISGRPWFQAKLHEADPPPEVLKAAQAELRKLRKMTEQAPLYGTMRSGLPDIARHVASWTLNQYPCVLN